MTIQEMGAVGEMIGGIAVIFTLIYLALQIRQANSIAGWQTHRAAVSSNAEVMSAIITDEDTARIYREGLLSLESLTPTDKIRLHQILIELLLNFKDTLDAYDRGLFDQPTYQAWQAHICGLLNTPTGKAWWAEGKNLFIVRVQEVVDQGMLEVPRADAVVPSFWSSGAHIEIESPNPDRSTFSGR